MHDMKKKAQLDVLKELRKAAMDDMGDGMQDKMKKVTVAAPDTQHLKQGLHKAEDMLENSPFQKPANDQDYTDLPEGDHEPIEERIHKAEDDNFTGETADELDAKIMELMDKKHKLKSQGK